MRISISCLILVLAFLGTSQPHISEHMLVKTCLLCGWLHSYQNNIRCVFMLLLKHFIRFIERLPFRYRIYLGVVWKDFGMKNLITFENNMTNRPFSYSTKEPGSNVIVIHFCT